MAYAREIKRGSRREMVLFRSHPSRAALAFSWRPTILRNFSSLLKVAIENRAKFIDLNCGCPTYEVVRRGLGACLLSRANVVGRIVERAATAFLNEGLSVPITVKIRLGDNDNDISASKVARIVEESGGSAVSLHGRTRVQRYSKAADWDMVRQLVQERSIPINGNGDVLTHYEARYKKRSPDVRP